MRKQNIFIVLTVLTILVLSIGYSIFRTNVTVKGKSATVKDFDVIFEKVGKITEDGSTDASAVIDETKKIVTISVPKLMRKGAYAIIPITIKNTGSVPAKLESIVETGLNEGGAITVSYSGIGITDAVLTPGDESNFEVKVKWENDLKDDYEEIEFFIKFNYVQG